MSLITEILKDCKDVGFWHLIHDAGVLANFELQLAAGAVNDRELATPAILSLLTELPADSIVKSKLEYVLIKGLWDALPHPGAGWTSYCGPNFRNIDGASTNPALPEIGKTNSPYIRHVPTQNKLIIMGSPKLPKPEVVFDTVMKRGAVFKPHPHNISALTFYIATLITHDLFNTKYQSLETNQNSSYLDASWLYGNSLALCNKIRDNDPKNEGSPTAFRGRLYPDVYADPRLVLQPPGLGAIVMLFNRNHNFIADKLNTDERFALKPTGTIDMDSRKQRDEQIFQTARAINISTYVSVVVHDYLRVLTGFNRPTPHSHKLTTFAIQPGQEFPTHPTDPPYVRGNQCAIEFNYIYRWHSALSEQDATWLTGLVNVLKQKFHSDSVIEIVTQLRKQAGEADPLKALYFMDEKFQPVARDPKTNQFPDEVLEKHIKDANTWVAGSFGGKAVPEVFKEFEILAINQSRQLGVCTLNEYRKFLKLKQYTKFEDVNSDPAIWKELQKLYPTVDDIELYPGLVVEEPQKPHTPGVGLAGGYSSVAGILSDAVALVRGDRFVTTDQTPKTLTDWGYHDCQGTPDKNYGLIFGEKLLTRHLGAQKFPPTSIRTVFPFTIPTESRKNVDEGGVGKQYTD